MSRMTKCWGPAMCCCWVQIYCLVHVWWPWDYENSQDSFWSWFSNAWQVAWSFFWTSDPMAVALTVSSQFTRTLYRSEALLGSNEEQGRGCARKTTSLSKTSLGSERLLGSGCCKSWQPHSVTKRLPCLLALPGGEFPDDESDSEEEGASSNDSNNVKFSTTCPHFLKSIFHHLIHTDGSSQNLVGEWLKDFELGIAWRKLSLGLLKMLVMWGAHCM